ncbi:hypothetical protein EG352_09400 [Chryseobacterium indologenes]|uniref:Uncharacterized protein n=3 Tax=Chryseobacterium indologenes TaxID=253 RepID=A0AAD0YVT2_CHRID|nr:hypothetical protein EG352_09400 [Chryseobacterium indologenes]
MNFILPVYISKQKTKLIFMEKANFYFILILALLLVSSYSYENQPNLSGSAVDPSERQHLYTSDAVRNMGYAVSINDPASEDPKNIPPKK